MPLPTAADQAFTCRRPLLESRPTIRRRPYAPAGSGDGDGADRRESRLDHLERAVSAVGLERQLELQRAQAETERAQREALRAQEDSLTERQIAETYGEPPT